MSPPDGAAAAAAPQDVPEEVLRYLAGLGDAAGQDLLAQAREFAKKEGAGANGEAARQPQPLCDFRRDCGPDCACPAHPLVAQEPLAADARLAVGEEEAKDAAQNLVLALNAGNMEAAEAFRRKADFGHIDESGWTCLHWLVHTAGIAQVGDGRTSEDQAQVADTPDSANSLLEGSGENCGCCSPLAAVPGSRALLRRVLAGIPGIAGVSVDARSADGATPLMFAADSQDREICEWLLSAGADPTAQDADGDTAAAWARAQGNEELARWFQDLPKSA